MKNDISITRKKGIKENEISRRPLDRKLGGCKLKAVLIGKGR
jgi:hypothetical protein